MKRILTALVMLAAMPLAALGQGYYPKPPASAYPGWPWTNGNNERGAPPVPSNPIPRGLGPDARFNCTYRDYCDTGSPCWHVIPPPHSGWSLQDPDAPCRAAAGNGGPETGAETAVPDIPANDRECGKTYQTENDRYIREYRRYKTLLAEFGPQQSDYWRERVVDSLREARSHYLYCLNQLPAEYTGDYQQRGNQVVFFDTRGNQYWFPLTAHRQMINPATFLLAQNVGGLLYGRARYGQYSEIGRLVYARPPKTPTPIDPDLIEGN